MHAHSGRDPIGRMRVYKLAAALLANAWADGSKLKNEVLTRQVAEQLYSAVASIQANLGEGYGRSSGRDRARLFEYALGSTREAMVWYEAASPVLGSDITAARLGTLEEIRRMLLAIIPRERVRTIAPKRKPIPQ